LFVVIYKVTQLFLQVVYKMPGALFVSAEDFHSEQFSRLTSDQSDIWSHLYMSSLLWYYYKWYVVCV